MAETLPRCPYCNARMVPSPEGDRLWCQFCGATRDDPEALQAARQYQAAHRSENSYQPPVRDWDMDPILLRALDDGWECIQEGDLKTARLLLNDAQSRFPDSADVCYLLALTTDDRGEKRVYLERALQLQPYHEYAWRDKGVLDGVISVGNHPALAEVAPGEAVAAQSETEACPSCGGALAFDAALGACVCRHCGYRPDAPPGTATRAQFRGGYQKLENALLQRRFGFTHEWHIGARVLVCQNCGAQLTLSGATLSTQCPFCDSAHILIRDAVGSFEEPDAILPFAVDRQTAAKAVHYRLAPDQRPAVERGEMWAVYLPFWAFQGMASVIVPPTAVLSEAFRPGVYGVNDVLVAGVTRPGQAVLSELMPFDLGSLRPYDHRYLARWSAQLYSLDVIQASITARAYLKYMARRHATGFPSADTGTDLARTDFNAYNPPDTPLWRIATVEIEEINYRLLLLPVWMIALVMRDGTRRPAVVNGQTGEVVLLTSFADPETIIAGPNRPPVEPLPLHTRNPIHPIGSPRRNAIRPIQPRR
jgi:DNA-directed RNA polymerase subunit M/transcription elongation factor TFIIS